MLYNFIFFLTKSTKVVDGAGEAVAPVAEPAVQAVNDAAQTTGGLFGMGSSGIMMILVYAAIIGAMWFFMVRPQRKREKEIREMQASIKSGDNVVTTSGFYGKVVSVGEDCFIIEFGTNKGVKVPVRKSDIIGIKTPNIGSSISSE